MDHPGQFGSHFVLAKWISSTDNLQDQITCINYSGTRLLPPLLNKQVAVYKFSIWNWLFKRGCLSILVAIKTGCTDGVYILEMQHLVSFDSDTMETMYCCI